MADEPEDPRRRRVQHIARYVISDDYAAAYRGAATGDAVLVVLRPVRLPTTAAESSP